MVPSNSDFEAAQVLEVYLIYDGPQFYSANVGDKFFVFLGVAPDLWVCKELTSVEILIKFEQGRFDSKDLFLEEAGRLFLWQSFSDDMPHTAVLEIGKDEVQENKWHLPAGKFFQIRKPACY